MKYKAAVLQLRAGLESLERNATLPSQFDINKTSHFIAKSAGKEGPDRELHAPAIRRVQMQNLGHMTAVVTLLDIHPSHQLTQSNHRFPTTTSVNRFLP